MKKLTGVRTKGGTITFRVNGREFGGDFETEQEAFEERNRVKAQLKAIKKGLPVPSEVEDVLLWLGSGKRKGYRKSARGEYDLDKLIKQYLKGRVKRVNAGKLSDAQYNQDEWFLEFFCKWFDSNFVSLDHAFAGSTLDDFKLHVESHFDSLVSQKHAVRTVGTLIDYAYEIAEVIDNLPRNLKKFRKVETDEAEAKVITIEDLKTLYESATDSMKLYMTLALNCGYTQGDISTLTHNMVDWESGRINRSRHKTRGRAKGKSPQPSKLWPCTVAMLNTYKTEPNEDGSNPVLLSENGYELVRRKDKVDNVGRAFTRLKRKTGVPNSFKGFRPTGATLIRNSYVRHSKSVKTNKELADLYLAHKPEKMERPYIEQDFQELFMATDWLLEHLKASGLPLGESS